jgi:hypothetical protein
MIDPAAPDKPFEALWDELLPLQQSGRVLGMFHGSTFSIAAVVDSFVRIDSHGIGLLDIPRSALSWTYAHWSKYRYQELSNQNSEMTLYAVSLIDHVVNIWVRREQRDELVKLARASKHCDAVFWVVHYNERGRYVGPKPVGEEVGLAEVFPDELPTILSSLESNARRLLGEFSMSQGDLAYRYPGYSAEIYDAVVMKNQISSR